MFFPWTYKDLPRCQLQDYFPFQSTDSPGSSLLNLLQIFPHGINCLEDLLKAEQIQSSYMQQEKSKIRIQASFTAADMFSTVPVLESMLWCELPHRTAAPHLAAALHSYLPCTISLETTAKLSSSAQTSQFTHGQHSTKIPFLKLHHYRPFYFKKSVFKTC